MGEANDSRVTFGHKEEGMSKQKNKLLVAMCAMCIAFLGVVGALVGVLAASTQSVGSTFSVNYDVGNNIAFKVDAYMQYEGEESYTMIGTTQYNADGTIESEIPKQDIVFTADVNKVRIAYFVQNLNDNVINLTCTWTDAEDYVLANFASTEKFSNIYVGFDGSGYSYAPPSLEFEEKLSILSSLPFQGVSAGAQDLISFPLEVVGSAYSVTLNRTDEYYMIGFEIGVADINRSAYCISEGTGGLTWTFTDTDVVQN